MVTHPSTNLPKSCLTSKIVCALPQQPLFITLETRAADKRKVRGSVSGVISKAIFNLCTRIFRLTEKPAENGFK